MRSHPYRDPAEPTPPSAPERRPPQSSDVPLLVLFLLVGGAPVVAALSRGSWSAEASLGMTCVLFAVWAALSEAVSSRRKP